MAVRHKMPYAAIESVLRATSSKIGDTSLYIWARTWRCKLYKDSTGAVYAKLSLNGSLNAVNHHANTRTSPNPTIRPMPRINCAGPSHLCLVFGGTNQIQKHPPVRGRCTYNTERTHKCNYKYTTRQDPQQQKIHCCSHNRSVSWAWGAKISRTPFTYARFADTLSHIHLSIVVMVQALMAKSQLQLAGVAVA